jgi:hypothetical protein
MSELPLDHAFSLPIADSLKFIIGVRYNFGLTRKLACDAVLLNLAPLNRFTEIRIVRRAQESGQHALSPRSNLLRGKS